MHNAMCSTRLVIKTTLASLDSKPQQLTSDSATSSIIDTDVPVRTQPSRASALNDVDIGGLHMIVVSRATSALQRGRLGRYSSLYIFCRNRMLVISVQPENDTSMCTNGLCIGTVACSTDSIIISGFQLCTRRIWTGLCAYH